MQINAQNPHPHVYVQSKHPFLMQVISKLLIHDPTLHFAGMMSAVGTRNSISNLRILLLDSCSIEHWRESASRWSDSGGKTILLIHPQSGDPDDELRFVCLGVHGILHLSADLEQKIFEAIRSVAQGRIWITNSALGEFVRRNVTLSSPLTTENLTSREQQVAKLILRGLANKEIADLLAIAERTVKFHVSNILQKCNVENRRDLLVRLNNAGQQNTADTNRHDA